MSSSDRPILEQALVTLIPTYTHKHTLNSNDIGNDIGINANLNANANVNGDSSLPAEVVSLAASLLAHSRSKAASLKAEEEIARSYACAHLACERLKQRLNLPRIHARPPCAPRVYKKLYDYLDSVLLLRKGNKDSKDGRGVGRGNARGDNVVTPTKRRREDRGAGAQLSVNASRTSTRTPTKSRETASGGGGWTNGAMAGSLSVASTKLLRQVNHHVVGDDIGSPTGTPTKTPARKLAGLSSSTAGQASGGNVMGEEQGSVDARKRRQQLKKKLQQQQQHQRNAFRDAINNRGIGKKLVIEEPPDWTMPVIRKMCAALEVPRAAPHVYTGVRSVMTSESVKENRDDPGRKCDKKAKNPGEIRSSKSKDVRTEGQISSDDDQNIISVEDENDENGTSRSDTSSVKNIHSEYNIRKSAQTSSPIAFTKNPSNFVSQSKSNEKITINIMALTASLLFYAVARMRGTDTSPEDFIRQRDAAIDVLLSAYTTGAIDGNTIANSTKASIADGDDDDNYNDRDNDNDTAKADEINAIKNDETMNDRRSLLLSRIERTMRAAQNGWLLLEWYQNIREGSFNTDWDEDDDGDGDDSEDGGTGYESNNGHAADGERGGRASYYTPQKSRDGNGNGNGYGNGKANGKAELEMPNGLTGMSARKIGVNGDASQQQPSLCSTMMQYQVDYLSEGRRADYVRWKAGIMARMEEIEKRQGTAKT